MNTSGHLSLTQLADYVDGRLPAEDGMVVKAHLDSGCESCNQSLQFLNKMKVVASTAAWAQPPRHIHKKVVNAFGNYGTRRSRLSVGFLRWLIPAAVSLVLIAILVFSSHNVSVAYAASLTNVIGTVEMRLSPGGDWVQVVDNQAIPEQAEIRAGGDGSAIITMPDGAQIHVNPGAAIQLVKLSKHNGKWDAVMNQSTGSLQIHTNDGTSELTIQTLAGEITTNSASFDVVIDQDGSTLVNVDEGDVEVKGSSGTLHIPKGKSVNLQIYCPVETPMPKPTKDNPGKQKSTCVPTGNGNQQDNPGNPIPTDSTGGQDQNGNPVPDPQN